MAVVTINFLEPINISCQKNDIAYWVPTGAGGGFDINTSSIIEIGPITSISADRLTLTATTFVAAPPVGAFILFGKDNKANLSSLMGYYAELDIRCNEISEHAELFRISGDYFESSK
tara:strand:+ start:13530 stop:13880 length:351 start_codon:yes stop_codon:yes gene_type:complete